MLIRPVIQTSDVRKKVLGPVITYDSIEIIGHDSEQAARRRFNHNATITLFENRGEIVYN